MKKKLFLSTILLYICFLVYGENSDVFGKTFELIEQEKYYSAIQYLYTEDPDNEDLDLVILKSKIFRNYFGQSLNHVMWGLKDLENDENLDEVRTGSGELNMYMFDTVEILTPFLDDNRFKVLHELGLYYHSVIMGYGNSLNESFGDVSELSRKNLSECFDNNFYDDESLTVLGTYYFQDQNMKMAEELFRKALDLNGNNPAANFNYGFILYRNGLLEEAVKYVRVAAEGYLYRNLSIDAYSFAGFLYHAIENYKDALLMFDIALEANPMDYRAYPSYIDSLIKTGDLDKAKERTLHFMMIEPANSYVGNQLIPIYKDNGQIDLIVSILEDCIVQNSNNDETLANFYFQKGNVGLLYNKDKGLEDLLKAKEYFLKFSDRNHPAVKAINGYFEN
ncbi:tetratricopeptide repeat protein [Oceanispirochaeta crateris]|uniref:Tetratricopeptide repeat protein n=1 Tax=Oceanispirochaeta crateris TaxID=2518645 RepID=A0A5C1QMC9_9SPIO|nr:tetratricopeptide repeat protein [Oceanispirochaeta crateris]QEN07312.1 tetratricopeptide repeat protein [Oceanispirochaeta crateris]